MNPVNEMIFNPQGREIARIYPDGTWWMAPDITLMEIQTAFHPLLETAATLLKKSAECRQRHEA